MDKDDKRFFRGLASEALSAHQVMFAARRTYENAAKALVSAMAGAEYDQLYYGDHLFRVVCPDDGEAFLTISGRPSVDLDL